MLDSSKEVIELLSHSLCIFSLNSLEPQIPFEKLGDFKVDINKVLNEDWAPSASGDISFLYLKFQ